MNELLDRRRAFLILNGLPNIGPIFLNRLLLEFENDPTAILQAGPTQLMQLRDVGAESAESIAHWREHFNHGT